MTKEQIYHRRLARKYGLRAIECMSWRHPDYTDYRGAGSYFEVVKLACWHAFKAHPELREDCLCPAHPSFVRKLVGNPCGNCTVRGWQQEPPCAS